VAILIELTKSAGVELLAGLLPRGPAWDSRQPFLAELLEALDTALMEAYNRIVDMLKEADPRLATQTLAAWLTAWGLPATGESLPVTTEGQRALLVGKVTAQGGQSREYYLQVVRTILDDDAAVVTITERPYGAVFAAWVSDAWDLVVGVPLMHHWWVSVPIGPASPKWAAIESILDLTRPAHTVVTLVEA